MLSTKIITNVDEATDYYMGASNYYTGSSVEKSENPGVWYGKGAEALDIKDKVVEAELFKNLLYGKLPSGQQLGKQENDCILHRAGFDLTFSLPKKVSLLFLLTENQELKNQIQTIAMQSVRHVLDLIEKEYAQTRITRNKQTRFVNTDNLTYALFLHHLSRENDPALHVHVVTINATLCEDKKWRSLASNEGDYTKGSKRDIQGVIERIRHDKKYLGLLFRAECAYALKKAGFEIEVTDRKEGYYDVGGISDESAERFSTRSNQIRDRLKNWGVMGGKAAAAANQVTREKKVEIDPARLYEGWKAKEALEPRVEVFKEVELLTEKLINPKDGMKDSILEKNQETIQENDPENKKNHKDQNNDDFGLQFLHYAVQELSENDIKINTSRLIGLAFQMAPEGSVNIESLAQGIQELVKEGELIPMHRESGDVYYTSKILLSYEEGLISALKEKCFFKNSENGENKEKEAGSQNKKIDAFLSAKSFLSQEQQEAIKALFQSDSRISILEGRSNTGKTFLLKPMSELSQLLGYQPIVLSHSQKDSHQLAESLRESAHSFKDFLKYLFDSTQFKSFLGFKNQLEKYIEEGRMFDQESNKKIIFVENANLLSTKQVLDFSFLLSKINAKAIFLIDKESVVSRRPGNATQTMLENSQSIVSLSHVFSKAESKNREIKNNNMKSHHMERDHILNNDGIKKDIEDGSENISNHDDLELATTDTLKNNIKQAFEKLGNRILSVPIKEEMYRQMASQYVSFSQEEREKITVLMQTKVQTFEFSVILREVLKEQGLLPEKDAITVNTLQSVYINETGFRFAKNYKEGQVVRFNEVYESLGIAKNEYLKIKSIQKKDNTIVLVNKQGEPIIWNPALVGGKSQKVEVFEERSLPLSVGDMLVWKRGLNRTGLVSGEKFRVSLIGNDKNITLERIEKPKRCLDRVFNSRIEIDVNQDAYRHFDYAYASIPNHRDELHLTMAYMSATSRQSDQKQFYKTLAQSTRLLALYTEDRDRLLGNLEKYSGDKDHVIGALIKSYAKDSLLNEHQAILEKVLFDIISKLNLDLKLNKNPLREDEIKNISKEALKYAVHHLAEREAVFDHKVVVGEALKYALGDALKDHVEKEIDIAEKSGALIKGIFSKNGVEWTTQHAIDMERAVINLAKEDVGRMKPLLDPERLQDHLKNLNLKKDHLEGIQDFLTSRNRVNLIQGFAGTGKTTLFALIDSTLKEFNTGCSLICLAPTNKAVGELRNRGLEAQTVKSFLLEKMAFYKNNEKDPIQYPIVKNNYRQIVAVDENSMNSIKTFLDLLNITKRDESLLLAVGDIAQHSGVDFGKPHTLLQAAGIHTIYLDQIIRQKNPELLKAVLLAYDKKFEELFNLLKNRIIEAGEIKYGDETLYNPMLLIEKMVQDFLKSSKEERASIGICSTLNRERNTINDLITKELRESGELEGLGQTIEIYVSKDMTAIQQTKVFNFEKGDVIRFASKNHELGIEKGEYLTVVEISEKENRLGLKNKEGTMVVWKPKDLYQMNQGDVSLENKDLAKENENLEKEVEVYQVEQREVFKNHLIRWTRTDKDRSLIGAELATIQKIEGSQLTVQATRLSRDKKQLEFFGSPFVIDTQKPYFKHFDFSYCVTNVGVQAATYEQMLALLSSHSFYLTNQAALVVALTRPEYIFSLYTDNIEKLLQKIFNTPGTKTSSLEAIGEVKINPDQIKNRKLELASKKEWESKLQDYQDQRESKREVELIENYQLKRLQIRLKEQGALASEKINVLYSNAKYSSVERIKIIREEDKDPGESWTRDQKSQVEYAQRLAKNAGSLGNTLAERYLAEHCGFNFKIIFNRLDDIRFHPGIYLEEKKEVYPAILLIAKNKKDKVQAVKAIFLDEKTGDRAHIEGLENESEKIFGVVAKTSVKLNALSFNKKIGLITQNFEEAISVISANRKIPVNIVLNKESIIDSLKNTDFNHKILCVGGDEKVEKINKIKKTQEVKSEEAKQEKEEKIINLQNEKNIQDKKETKKELKNIWILPQSEDSEKNLYHIYKNEGGFAVESAIAQAIKTDDLKSTEEKQRLFQVEEFKEIRGNNQHIDLKRVSLEYEKNNFRNEVNAKNVVQMLNQSKKLKNVERSFEATNTNDHGFASINKKIMENQRLVASNQKNNNYKTNSKPNDLEQDL